MSQNPELQRLLAAINGYGQNSPRSNVNGNSFAQEPPIPGLGFPPPESLNVNIQAVQQQNVLRPTADPRLQKKQLQPQSIELDRSRSSTPSAAAIPDASTITTWPAALKHVTKHLASNEQVTVRIKHLINEQHKHEEQWRKQRDEIVAKHAGRAGNQTKVADILKELGGLAVPIAKVDEAADKNELETFDKKVYKSLVQMAGDFDGQLRKLGVPFFVIKHELVRMDDGKEKGSSMIGKLDKGELRELQKRMLEHLEDLLSDD